MTSAASENTFYNITYKDPIEGKVVSLKAKKIHDSSLGMSFIAISDFVFNTSNVVVDPAEESLSKKFQNIKKLHLSIYGVISVEEIGVEHKGLSFINDKSNLVVFPKNETPPI